jgi:biotin-(acetyl-CoA carboxylase) ligase
VPLDAARLAELLSCNCQLVVKDRVGSTNDEAFAYAQRGASPDFWARPLVVVSAEQTAGRGRLGRTWVSPPGGIYLSILLDSGSARGREHSLSPLAALATRVALDKLTSDELLIKWPNDIVSTRGKLAGILVESKRVPVQEVPVQGALPQGALFTQEVPAARGASQGASVTQPRRSTAPSSALIVGIGVNVNCPGAGGFETAAYLNDGADGVLPLEDVAAAIIDRFFRYHTDWLAADGSFAPFMDEYAGHMALMRERVCVRDATGAEVAGGIVEGIDASAQLLLRGPSAMVAVAAGEVTLRDNLDGI